jgi:hypothetical protein
MFNRIKCHGYRVNANGIIYFAGKIENNSFVYPHEMIKIVRTPKSTTVIKYRSGNSFWKDKQTIHRNRPNVFISEINVCGKVERPKSSISRYINLDEYYRKKRSNNYAIDYIHHAVNLLKFIGRRL